MIDLILLQVLKDKEQYDILRPSVRDHLVADTTLTLIRDYAAYFKHYETTTINWDMFPSWFRTQRHPTMKADDFEFYEKLFLRLAETPDLKLAETLKQDLQALDFATRVTNSANDLLDGKIDSKHFISGVQERLEKAIEAQEATAEVPWDTSSLGEVAKSLSYDDGLKFRLNCLDQSCGSLHAGRLVVTSAYTDTGKCLGKDTLVLMADGTKKLVQDVVVGDKLQGVNNQVRTVLGTTSGVDQLYKVTQNDGDDYIVNSKHILSMKVSKTGMYAGKVKGDVWNIPVLDYMANQKSYSLTLRGYKDKADFGNTEVKHPYLLGAWLADGSSDGTRITVGDTDYEYINAIHTEAQEYSYSVTQPAAGRQENCSSYSPTKGFLTFLRENSLLKNKHIPLEYLQASRASRLELLAGLLDGDGYLGATGNTFEICTKSNELAQDILTLARSLGLRANCKSRFKKCQNFDGAWYNIISICRGVDIIPTRLPRKQAKPSHSSKVAMWYGGVLVEPIGEGEYYGFSVDGDSLFLLGDFTVTHNSSILADQFMANFALQSATIKGKWFSDRPVMFFNNEGSSGSIKLMCHQALLNSPADRIQRNPEGAEEATLKRLQGKELMHVVPAQGMTIQEIERIVRKFKPCCVIIDMLDNVPSYYDAEGTSDQRFRMLYDHFRQMAVKYDFVAVATSQCTGDANGVERIPLHMMAGSRVAKQSTADLVIMLGKSLQAGKQHSRYIHTPKNKLQSRVPHANRDTDCEVIFDGERRRFKDPEEG